ncbi:hypothetical protein IM697_20065 [Streptomyces ferrugineus]|uniref:Uncharacterized protein n=1 Tax=Streptomyces ferrugineus TaxID=1413221 RepID=A0A7M2SY52_9ACTN|nr:hypothetical protein [Streptomyces ferrugineus]QOV40493.1 hypothetical protein IM697_20065 [Streptomyces ferrugineus]
MDLRTRLRSRVARRPRVFHVAVPGGTEARLGVEAELRLRGWPVSGTPADADLLIVCGTPRPHDAEWLDRLEAGMPQPAARVVVQGPARAAQALDTGAAALLTRPARAHSHEEARGGGHDGGHADHMDHDMHDMHGMGEVAGLPMAERADDRDQLRLDRLHLPLGPGLADWPAGLVLHLALQGDVVQTVEIGQLPVPEAGSPYWNEPWLRAAQGEEIGRGVAARRRCAAHLDSVGRFLAVVGWEDAAARCRRLRDEMLSGASRESIGGRLRATMRRVERSRTLRWGTAGLGGLSARRARSAGVTGPASEAGGDAYDRLRVWLREVERGLDELDDAELLGSGHVLVGPRGRLDGERPPSRALLDVLPELLTGAEFACARIILASLDPDLDELAFAPTAGAAHG